MESDSELVRQARDGRVEAFGILCRRYERTAVAVALSILANWHSAEDAVQQAMLIAFRKLPSLDDGAKFGGWLLTTVRRKSLEMKRQERPVTTTDFTDCGPTHPTTDDQAANRWVDREFVLQLVRHLSEADQLLIGLRYFDGHPYADIAHMTGRPIGAITKQISRAIERLRTKI